MAGAVDDLRTVISEHFPFLRQGILPDYVVQDAVSSGEVLTTLDDWRLSIFGTQIFMLYMPDRPKTRAVRTCIDHLLGRALLSTNRARWPSPASRLLRGSRGNWARFLYLPPGALEATGSSLICLGFPGAERHSRQYHCLGRSRLFRRGTQRLNSELM